MSMLGSFFNRSSQKKPRRPRSKAETEKRRRILIVGLIVLAVVAAVATVSYGYYDTNVKPWRQPILKVNGTTFDMRYFVKAMTWNGATTTEAADMVVAILEENELKKQYLVSEFDADLRAVLSDEAVTAEIAKLLGLSDNYTQEEYDEKRNAIVSQLAEYDLSEADLKELYAHPVLINAELQKQLGDRSYPATDNYEHARVQALLITGADNASLMRIRWENGATFGALAGEAWVSDSVADTDTDNVTPNWVARGIRSATFDNCTFNQPLAMIGDPIPDGEGSEDYWLIDVLAREARQLGESDRDILISNDLQERLAEARTSPENLIVDYTKQEGGTAKLVFAIEHVPAVAG